MQADPWLADTALSVVLAVGPLVFVFLVLQLLFLRLPAREVGRVLAGTAIAATGLFIFLLGVHLAFLPFGRLLGAALGGLRQPAWIVPAGMVLGFVTVWSEPAVRILADQVEEATGGSIRRTLVLPTIGIGVAVFTALGLLRIVYQIPLLALLLPGYGLLLAGMWFSKEEFVAIAIDAGGVATGPIANSFLLAVAFGASSALGERDPLVQGLGLVALIALAPALSLTLLGIVIRRKDPPRKG